ncbi:class I SAM-dependent methyltransferase [Marinicella rhabdoformis]|uniref:class I SAM-dependent methyltransferase n=1 Tax=Marinicella rhabdoformis TaxID=2580566 RepID=UPI0012AEB99D|nr:class I SAM-dependent methyltransferase [Marinicella rhabdoformis]
MKKIIYTMALLAFSPLSVAAEKNADTKVNAAAQSDVTVAMNAEGRTDADKARDARSRPDVTLQMLGVKAGDHVFDVFAGGGYYSELLARIVGAEGKVYLHNNGAYRAFVGEALKKRMDNNKFTQMIQHDREVDDLGMKAGSLDAAMIIMSFHDLFFDDSENGWPQIDRDAFMGQIHKGLKTGGRFMIVDHNAKAGTKDTVAKSLHRIEKAYAIEVIESYGFELKGESNVLGNADDDHSKSVFDKDMRGKTDRFVLVFTKAEK